MLNKVKVIKKLLVAVIGLAGLAAFGWWWKETGGNVLDKKYESKVGNYEIKYPGSWEVKEFETNESFKFRVEFSPTAVQNKYDLTGQLALTVVDKPKDEQMLTGEDEFTRWSKAETGKEEQGVTKVGQLKLDGKSVPVLATQEQDFWALTVWLRENNENIYLSTFGNGQYTQEELEFLTNVSRTLRLK